MIRLTMILILLASTLQAAELKVATWNLEWLTLRLQGDPELPENVVPKQAADIAVLRRYAEILDADVVALQEVDGPEVAALVFPPDRYRLIFTGDHVIQRVGFAVRNSIPVHRNPDLVALDLYPTALHRLRSGLDITLDLPSGPLRLLAVHLKTGCHEDRLSTSPRRECETLRHQLPPLQGWIAQRRDEGAPFVLLGDFNRRMDGREDVMTALNATLPLTRATEGHGSPCWGGGSFIDHIMAGGAARGWMEPNSLRVMVYREKDMAARDKLSDHCPVSVRFHLPD